MGHFTQVPIPVWCGLNHQPAARPAPLLPLHPYSRREVCGCSLWGHRPQLDKTLAFGWASVYYTLQFLHVDRTPSPSSESQAAPATPWPMPAVQLSCLACLAGARAARSWCGRPSDDPGLTRTLPVHGVRTAVDRNTRDCPSDGEIGTLGSSLDRRPYAIG